MTIRLDDLEAGLGRLAANIGWERKCNLPHVNSGALDGELTDGRSISHSHLPSAQTLKEMLFKLGLVPKVCEVYYQDYLCFNFTIPQECSSLQQVT